MELERTSDRPVKNLPSQARPPGVSPETARRGRRLLPKLLLLAGSLLIGLLLVEAAVRLLGADPGRLWEPDPVVGWHAVPGARIRWTAEGDGQVHINSHGFRDRERQLDKAPGTFRIAVFGDSMTEAVQVNLDQTFTYLLEKRLADGPRPVEVLNFGCSGYSTIQELLSFQREGPRYRPDLVILAVFLDNDVADCHPDLGVSAGEAPFVVLDGDHLRFDYSRAERSYADYHREPIYSLRKHSATFRLLTARWRTWKRVNVEEGTQGAEGPAIPRRYLLYEPVLRPEWQQAWANFERVVLEFAAEARRQQTPFVIVTCAAAQLVNPQVWQDIVATTPGMAGKEWDLEGPERRFAEFARQHSLPLLQAYKAYRQVPPEPPLFFGRLGHLTPRGHELLAQTIEMYLRERNLLPGT
ncbi:MAG TPA: SGNH/GDSL hydrolase family protein [Gemmataceae bacterium]|nr:SGNH/GDSL hydrolase family protein [Gemmataceae bacterium]